MHALTAAVRERRAILFVGAGVSMNLGLPSFDQLVDHLATELDYDPEIFATHGGYLELAEYYSLEKGSLVDLLSWMEREWHSGINIAKSRVHEEIVKLRFPIIYTTNYDSWLERAHCHYGEPYRKVATVEDLASRTTDQTEIIKFHGDFDDESSIVLTESQYFDRLDFESPLDIQLRADLQTHCVLFVGYSLSDINLRYMLYKLNHLWKTSTSIPRNPSFIFLTRPNPVQERVLKSRGITPLVSECDEPQQGLKEFLAKLRSEVESPVD